MEERIDPEVLKTASVLMVGVLAVFFDTTIVSVALQTLATSLHASVASIQWFTTGYLLALGVSVPLAGWAQARFGGKRVWLFALAVFLVGSMAASLAVGLPALIAARAVQGVGGGLLLPLLQTLIMQQAGGAAMGRTVALISLPIVLGPILGPVVGGAILHWLSWHWLFWVNVPFCVAGWALAWRYLPADRPRGRPRLDLVGLVLLGPGIVGVLLGLSNLSGSGPVVAPLLLGAALLVGFTVHALRAGERALVDLRLLTRQPMASTSAMLFLAGAALYGAMLLLPLYWQRVHGASALTAGLLLIPQGLGNLLSRTLAGRLTDRIGARWVSLGGVAVVGLATVPFALVTNEWLLMAALVVRGAGLGAVMIPLMAAGFIGLKPDDMPHASILSRITQQLGGSFGTALIAVVLDRAAARMPLIDAFDQAFWLTVGFTGLAVLLALTLPTRAPSPAAEPATTSAAV